MPDFVAHLIIRRLRDSRSRQSIPEWKEFTKIAGFGGVAVKYWADIQWAVLFGMAFGPGKPKNSMKEEPEGRVQIRIAKPADIKYVYPILKEMEASARVRRTGIAKRSPQVLCQKIYEGKAVIALGDNGDWAGFSYIEAWGMASLYPTAG